MTYEFRLPDVGEGIAEAEIVRWLVREGGAVALDEPLVQIETDKAIVEVPSPVAGKVSRHGGREGERLRVGDVLAVLQQAESASAATVADSQNPEVASSERAPGHAAGAPRVNGGTGLPDVAAAHRPLATPAVRKLAREMHIDLTSVAPSGTGGRITQEDVRAAASPGPSEQLAVRTPLAEAVGLRRTPLTTPQERKRATGLSGPSDSLAGGGDDERVPLRGLRRTIADAMATSWRTIPHLTGMDEVDVSALVGLREQLNASSEPSGPHMTYLPFIVKAVVTALKQYPIVNSCLDESAGEIVYRHRYNIGIATATPDGLLVPVIHDADGKTLHELQAELGELTERARNRSIALDALRNSTFTISNFGSLGGWLGTPIIRPGESAILGVGRIQEKPWVHEGQLAVRVVLALSLSADHRLIDGDVATAFMRCVAGYLGEPLRLFLEMA